MKNISKEALGGVRAIAAMTKQRVIGLNGKLPWSIPEDLRRFAALTRGSSLIMGRKTFESLPCFPQPLPDRRNIVLTSHPLPLTTPHLLEAKTWKKALALCADQNPLPWVIGGEKVFSQSLPEWREVYLTLVHDDYPGDTFMPHFESEFTLIEEEVDKRVTWQRYLRR